MYRISAAPTNILTMYSQESTPALSITTLPPASPSSSSILLRLPAARLADGGWYRCAAANYLGGSSRTRRVDVSGPPSVRQMADRVAVAGGEQWIHCPYVGYPVDKVEWRRKGNGCNFMWIDIRNSALVSC